MNTTTHFYSVIPFFFAFFTVLLLYYAHYKLSAFMVLISIISLMANPFKMTQPGMAPLEPPQKELFQDMPDKVKITEENFSEAQAKQYKQLQNQSKNKLINSTKM